MYFKLYKKQVRTNNLICENKEKINIKYIDYIFIVENDINKTYYLKNKIVDNKNSFVQLSITDGISHSNNIYKRKWSINAYSQIYFEIYNNEHIDELEKLFNIYLRKEKINNVKSK